MRWRLVRVRLVDFLFPVFKLADILTPQRLGPSLDLKDGSSPQGIGEYAIVLSLDRRLDFDASELFQDFPHGVFKGLVLFVNEPLRSRKPAEVLFLFFDSLLRVSEMGLELPEASPSLIFSRDDETGGPGRLGCFQKYAAVSLQQPEDRFEGALGTGSRGFVLRCAP